MKKSILGTIALGGLLLAGNACASGDVHWTYSGHGGPQHWGELTENFAVCGSGVNQSPINLTGFVEGELAEIGFSYNTTASTIVNNGHTVQANFPKGSSISIDNMEFDLLQCHFHAPSENNIDGKSFPMEGHCVHASKDGKLAVISIMYEIGDASKGIAALWANMPAHAGDKNDVKATVNATDIMPASKDYYRFNGSLTTPPCTEGVRWFVLKDTVTISKGQLKAFQQSLHEPNNRPLQPLNSRIIVK
jgi:carbonic anhydrase